LIPQEICSVPQFTGAAVTAMARSTKSRLITIELHLGTFPLTHVLAGNLPLPAHAQNNLAMPHRLFQIAARLGIKKGQPSVGRH
jgi:hypothetical protein